MKKYRLCLVALLTCMATGINAEDQPQNPAIKSTILNIGGVYDVNNESFKDTSNVYQLNGFGLNLNSSSTNSGLGIGLMNNFVISNNIHLNDSSGKMIYDGNGYWNFPFTLEGAVGMIYAISLGPLTVIPAVGIGYNLSVLFYREGGLMQYSQESRLTIGAGPAAWITTDFKINDNMGLYIGAAYIHGLLNFSKDERTGNVSTNFSYDNFVSLKSNLSIFGGISIYFPEP